MGKRFELIVFDWDGTLMDSTGAIVASIQAAARDLGIEPPSDERASHIIGLGLIDALRHALPDLPAERYQAVAERYRHHYLSRDQDLLLFDGAAELIAELAAAGWRERPRPKQAKMFLKAVATLENYGYFDSGAA